MKILLVEDDAGLAEPLAEALADEAYAVDRAATGAEADELAAVHDYDLVILDWGIPEPSGLELLRRWRAARLTFPVLMLTGRGELADRVSGLDGGADDYVVKPVAIAELAARLRAVVRRSQGAASGEIEVGELRIDPAARSVSYGGRPVELQPREFALLLELALNAGRVLTRAQMEARLYEWDRALDSNAIEVHVHHLRRKLSPDLIRTVRGVGYVLQRRDA